GDVDATAPAVAPTAADATFSTGGTLAPVGAVAAEKTVCAAASVRRVLGTIRAVAARAADTADTALAATATLPATAPITSGPTCRNVERDLGVVDCQGSGRHVNSRAVSTPTVAAIACVFLRARHGVFAGGSRAAPRPVGGVLKVVA